jgi:type II secretory pathway component PulM
MKASPSLSDLARRLEPRERRVVFGGAFACIAALAIMWGVLPFAQRWSSREARLFTTQDRWIRLQGLLASADRLSQALDVARRGAGSDQSQLVSGATPALAASVLQALLQTDASQSAVQLERIDAAGDPEQDKPGFLAIPVQLQARGDLYGFIDFMHRLDTARPILVVDELTVDAGSGPDDDGAAAQPMPRTLAWSVRLHGLYATAQAPGQ